MEVEAAMVMVRGAVAPGGVGGVGRPDGSGDQRVPPSAGAAISFVADTDGSLDSAYEDNFDCGEEAMQRRLLISRILSSPLLFCASPSPSSQESQTKAATAPDIIDQTNQTRSPMMISSGSSAGSLPCSMESGPHAPPPPSEASDEDTEDANLELSRADTEVYECSLSDASSPGKTASRDSSIRRDLENVPDTVMVDSPCAPDTSEEEEEIGEVSELAKNLRSEVARVLYEMISRVAMEYESLDEDSNDCESCPEVPCMSWRSRRPLSGRSVSTDSGVSSVHDDSRISISSHLSHCSSSQSSSQSSRSSEYASSPATTATPDSSDEAAISERTQRRRSSRLLDLSAIASAIGTSVSATPTTRPAITASSTKPPMGTAAVAAASARTPSAAGPASAAKPSALSAPTPAEDRVTPDRLTDHQPSLKVHVTAKSCATSTSTPSTTTSATAVRRSDGGSVTRSHSKHIITSSNNNNNAIPNNNSDNNSYNNVINNDKDSKHNMRNKGCDATGEALRLPGPAQSATLTVTAKGMLVPSPLQARVAATSFVKPSADLQLAFPLASAAPDPKPPHLPCRWKECGYSARKDFELADHIADAHVAAQGDKGPFVCLWEACKVFNVPSTLKHWLEQHVVKHSRSKPLKCIVDGCPQRFSTKALLEAHVNSHFEKNPKLKNETSLKSQNQLLKLAKRKRLLRQHSKMQAGRKYDFFDACIMHQIKEGLLQFAELEQTSSSTIAHHRNHYPAQPHSTSTPAKSASSDPSLAPLASPARSPQQPPNSGRKRSPPTNLFSTPDTPIHTSVPTPDYCPRRSSRRKVALTNELTGQPHTQAEPPGGQDAASGPVAVLRSTIDQVHHPHHHHRIHHVSVPSPDSGFDTSDPAASPPQLDEANGFSAALASAAAAGRLLIPGQHLGMTGPPAPPSASSGSALQRRASAEATSATAYKLDAATAAIAPFLNDVASRRSLFRRRGHLAGARGGTVCTRSMRSSMSPAPSSPPLESGGAAPLVESLARAVRTTRSGQRQMLISFYRPRRATPEAEEAER